MTKDCYVNGKIELYDVEKFKDWLFKELQKQDFVGVFDISIEEVEECTCEKCGRKRKDVKLYFDVNPIYLCNKCFNELWD